MKKIKIILVIISIFLATYTINTAAESIIHLSSQKNIIKEYPQQTLFEAEITFYIYEGEGCACNPIPDANILASSGDGYDEGLTDEDGKCILNMVINSEYLVSIESEDYNLVKYNFNVIDDQTFKFHIGEKNDDDSSYKILRVIPLKISQITQQLQNFINKKIST